MIPLIPPRLQRGDEVRIIAPSRSLSFISPSSREVALERCNQELGLKISFSSHCAEIDNFGSSSLHSRLSDLHEAFADKQIKAILTVIGGHNSNQLLRHIDYDLIRQNPKIFCGFSDITALQNAFLAKTGLITYSGPHFSTLGCLKGADYFIDYFKRALFTSDPIEIAPSTLWSDDAWYLDQNKREFLPNSGFDVIQEGEAQGRIIGGNLCTLNLLQGTEYMPGLKDSILFLEDDSLSFAENFDRDLQSLIHQGGFNEVRGLVIGRFQKASNITMELLRQICTTKSELARLPILANADFGHTLPLFTIPIGGYAKLRAMPSGVSLTLGSDRSHFFDLQRNS